VHGLRGYYKLNKADLKQLLASKPLLDDPVPEINADILTPELAKLQLSKADRLKDYMRSMWIDFTNWLQEYVPSKPSKVIDKAFEAVKKNIMKFIKKQETFEVKESKSGLKRKYTIDCKGDYNPETFMDGAKQPIINLLQNNR